MLKEAQTPAVEGNEAEGTRGGKKTSRVPSLARDYFIFAVAIGIVVVLLTAGFSISVYISEQQYKRKQLLEGGEQVERTIQEGFEFTERLSNVLGKQIVEHGVADPEFIADLFRKTSLPDVDPKNIFSWSLFDWVNHNNLQLVNTRLGVVRNRPADMSMRSYTKKCRLSPWTLQISKPTAGYPSGQWVIPVAMGVTSYDGAYMGAVVSGVNVGKLTQKIEQILPEGISFVLVGEDMGDDAHVVLSSDDVKIANKEKEFISKFIGIKEGLGEKSALLPKKMAFGDTEFIAQKKLHRYPYYVLMGYNKSLAWKDFQSILFPRLLEFAGMGVFCFILLLFFRRKIIRPIKKLSDVAVQIARGESNIVVPRFGIHEPDMLASQLDEVIKYITDLQETRAALAVKTEAAEVANRAKAEFLACISHELRTPLNAVIAFSEILKVEMFGPLGNKKYREYVGDIHESGTHLLNIINDILDITKAEAGKIVLRKQKTNLMIVIKACLMNVANNAMRGGVIVDVNVDKDLPYIISDEARLKQIITNLLSNAVKFTPEGGKVRISARVETKSGRVIGYYIIVQDTGIGMREEDIPRAVEKFGQLDTGLNRKFEGVGLGLPLAKKLVEIHHGTMTIESCVDKGTIVTVHFPQDHVEFTPLRQVERQLEWVN